jgi:hypothetical protein
MGINESIRSPFPTQPATHSPKLRIYESLFPLNQSVDQLVALLREIERVPFPDKESTECAVVEIEEVRCDVNADFTEKLADSELFDEGHIWEQRREFEKKWRDPDDVYIEVQRREEERKKKRLPPRVVFLPDWAIRDGQPYDKPQTERRKKAAKKRRKNAIPETEDQP